MARSSFSTEDLLLWGVVGFGLYFFWKQYQQSSPTAPAMPAGGPPATPAVGSATTPPTAAAASGVHGLGRYF